MEWYNVKDKKPDDGESVILKIHVTSMGGVIDREEDKPAVYKDRKWYVDGKILIENDYPIMREPVQWARM